MSFTGTSGPPFGNRAFTMDPEATEVSFVSFSNDVTRFFISVLWTLNFKCVNLGSNLLISYIVSIPGSMYRISSIPKLNNSARVGRKYLLFRKTPFIPPFRSSLNTPVPNFAVIAIVCPTIGSHKRTSITQAGTAFSASFSMIPVTQS